MRRRISTLLLYQLEGMRCGSLCAVRNWVQDSLLDETSLEYELLLALLHCQRVPFQVFEEGLLVFQK